MTFKRVSLLIRECAEYTNTKTEKKQLSNCSLYSASRCMELSSYTHTSCGTTCHSHHTASCHSKNQASCNCSTKCAQIPMPDHFDPQLTQGSKTTISYKSALPLFISSYHAEKRIATIALPLFISTSSYHAEKRIAKSANRSTPFVH